LHRAGRGIRTALALLALATACSKDSGVANVLVVSRVEITPPSGAIVVGQNLQLAAIAKTEGGIPLPSRTVTWSSSDNQTATVTADGLVHAASVGGPVKIRATVEGVVGETDITVVAFPIDHIVVAPPTTSIKVGETTQLVATAFDEEDRPLTGRTFLWASSSPQTAAVTTTGLVIGMAAGGPVTISVSAEGKSASGAVTVTARPATRLGFVQQPTSTVANVSIAPPIKVAIQDDVLGTVLTATDNVTIAFLNPPANATLSGTLTVPAVNGIATFSNLSINRAGNNFILTATAAGLSPANSNSFSILAGEPSALTFTTAPPTTARSGQVFTSIPVVQLRDASGNPVESAGVVVTATAIPAGPALGGTTEATTAANGTATFTGLSLNGSPGSYAISFKAPNIPALVSAPIALSAGTPILSITTQPPAAAQHGVTFSQAPVVKAQDVSGNGVSGVPITVLVTKGNGTLAGTATVTTNSAGQAAFPGLSLSGKVGKYELTFTAPQLPPVTSSEITLTAGPPSQLSIITQPAGARSGQPFIIQPVIRVLDAADNPVSGVSVIATVNACSLGNASLSGTTTVLTDIDGFARYTNLTLTGLTLGGCTLKFTSGSLSEISDNIAVSL
jgi:hypothetical protein